MRNQNEKLQDLPINPPDPKKWDPIAYCEKCGRNIYSFDNDECVMVDDLLYCAVCYNKDVKEGSIVACPYCGELTFVSELETPKEL